MELSGPSIEALIRRWRDDPGGTYRTWFLWDERIKNFRSIRRGVGAVVAEIAAGSFGTAYRGSSLEVVVESIAEQRQIFRGADHAFLWKPKLRIPDIYESPGNQRAFGQFLDTCLCCDGGDPLVAAIRRLDEHRIKGLGPAVANLLYFLHPTEAVPSNTAIVKGYNALMGAKVKLGRWDEYLAMRAGVLRLNAEHRQLLSNDLGAVAGFLFDVGAERYPLPAAGMAPGKWEADLLQVREEAVRDRRARERDAAGETTHTEVQEWLRDLGKALGFRVFIAANDQGRTCRSGKLGDGCLPTLPPALEQGPGADAIRLIDVLWVERDVEQVAAAFEVEHSTSIHSGIVRMLDLATSQAEGLRGMFIVAPDDREDEVRRQVTRPAFRSIGGLGVRYLPYGELARHRDVMARFGDGLKAVIAASRML